MVYSLEDNIVEVKPLLQKDLQFYKLKIEEKTICNGIINEHEIIKKIHLTTTKIADVGYEYHIEVFDRTHRNREYSLSEKDLVAQIATFADDLKIVLDENLNFVAIKNFDNIKKKAKHKIEILSKKYIGENATKLFEHLQRFYNHEKLLYDDLQRYDKFGLILIKFLGYYSFGKTKNHRIRYTNFLNNTLLEVNETIKLSRLNREIEGVELQLNGEINGINFNKKMFENEMKFQNIIYSEKDIPTLEKYEGKFLFNTKTGKINNSEVHIVFSFGKNYSKELQYKLTKLEPIEM